MNKPKADIEIDLYAVLPTIIGSKGVEEIIQLDLQDNEKQAFQKSVEAIQTMVSSLKAIIK